MLIPLEDILQPFKWNRTARTWWSISEQAQAAVGQDTFTKSPHSSIWEGLASGVPSQVRGLLYIHENDGKLPWETVVEPAVSLAQDVWIVNEDTVQNLDWGLDFCSHPNTEVPSWAIDIAPNGTLLGLGNRPTRKRLGATLKRIADEGPNAFHTGAIAATVVAALAAENGVMTLEDVSRYR